MTKLQKKKLKKKIKKNLRGDEDEKSDDDNIRAPTIEETNKLSKT